jgi:hypothetical protein
MLHAMGSLLLGGLLIVVIHSLLSPAPLPPPPPQPIGFVVVGVGCRSGCCGVCDRGLSGLLLCLGCC